MNVSFRFAWAQTLLFFGLSTRALPVFREVVRADPRHTEAWSVLAFLHAEKGELSEAIPAFERALAPDPRLPASGAGYRYADHGIDATSAAIASTEVSASAATCRKAARSSPIWMNADCMPGRTLDTRPL